MARNGLLWHIFRPGFVHPVLCPLAFTVGLDIRLISLNSNPHVLRHSMETNPARASVNSKRLNSNCVSFRGPKKSFWRQFPSNGVSREGEYFSVESHAQGYIWKVGAIGVTSAFCIIVEILGVFLFQILSSMPGLDSEVLLLSFLIPVVGLIFGKVQLDLKLYNLRFIATRSTHVLARKQLQFANSILTGGLISLVTTLSLLISAPIVDIVAIVAISGLLGHHLF